MATKKTSKKSKPTRKAKATDKKATKKVASKPAKAKPALKKKPQAFAAVATDPLIANLDKIDHIVVLMMENRSFDHILGYLTIEEGRTDVDGLTNTMHNDYKGTPYPPKLRTNTAFGSKQDPCHGGTCVDEQLSNNNGGFVSNYARKYPNDPE